MFLIRDYQFDELRGFDGGMTYLNEVFAESNYSLLDAFDSAHCFMLSYPGKTVATTRTKTEIQIKGKKLYVVFFDNFSKKNCISFRSF